MPSITSWVRLEPRCHDADMNESVRARIADPLWLLARQWQTAEFQAEDTGSPVLARWRAASTPITRYHAGAIPPNTRMNAPRYTAAAMPLEAIVERQKLRSGPDPRASLRLAVESALHFLRMLDAQATSRSYRSDFIRRFVLQAPNEAERAGIDRETLAYWNLMAGRVPDARRLFAAFRAADGRRLPLPADLGVAAGDRAEVDRAVDDWLADQGGLFTQPEAAQDAWNPERLEYAFSIGAAFGNAEMDLTAAEYSEGHLDWHSVDLDGEINLGASQDNAAASSCARRFRPPSLFAARPRSASGRWRTRTSTTACSPPVPAICRTSC